MAKHLKQARSFDVLIDDDRAGEAADLVGLTVDRGDVLITLVHCKYSADATAGGRLKDLYEVCGQATRGARWRDNGALPLLEHLDRRVASYAKRTGGTAFEVGDGRRYSVSDSAAPRSIHSAPRPGPVRVKLSR